MGGLEGIVVFLQAPAFKLLGAPVSWSELIGDATGLACVWLLARQHILSWPIGIVNNVFFCFLFFNARLYGDSVLQVVFAVMGAYGWWSWVRGAAKGAKKPLLIRKTRSNEWIVFAILGVVFTAIFAWWLAHHTNSPVPFWDALVLVMSLVATYGQAIKLLESWWIWIAVDVVSAPLYVSRGLYPTALLYVLFGVLCVVGLRDWKRTLVRGVVEVKGALAS